METFMIWQYYVLEAGTHQYLYANTHTDWDQHVFIGVLVSN